MKQLSLLPLVCSLFFCSSSIQSQDVTIQAVQDSICLEAGDSLSYNVTSNDSIFQPGDIFVFLIEQSACIGMDFAGNLFFLPGAGDCCGEHRLRYRYENCQQPSICEAEIVVVIKCEKPDCSIVDLSDFFGGDDPSGNPMEGQCVGSCEFATATYFVPYINTNTYVWSVTGGTMLPGANPAEISVTWGPMGTGSITLSVTSAAGETATNTVCVDILPSPTADFTKSADTICLNSTVYFTNTSTDANDWFWDFGDGFTSTTYSPNHTYTAAGTYTVLLTVTKDNFGPDGAALCCCTDTMAMEIVVDPLPGPDIQWVSTLCAGDSSKYWTTATNCTNYTWTVLDADSMPVAFTGQGTDTICVSWGDGPFGTINLDVAGCDEDYCPVPSRAIVPIISPIASIDGLIEVCENEVATYTAPKWTSVAYDWQVSGGTILAGEGTNTIVVQWGTAPGPGTINLNYYSDFLGGLPNQDPSNCGGSGDLSVAILPAFDINGLNLVCNGDFSTYFATPFPAGAFTWTISPAVTFSGQGSNTITVNWDAGPGSYLITATPNDPTAFCNDAVNISVTVVDVPPPTGIDGPAEICPGQTATYFGQTSESGVGFSWIVTGGTPVSALGDPLIVSWNATGPYGLAVRQFLLNNPFCSSDTIQIPITPKVINGPLNISGPAGCTNDVLPYTLGPPQHPDATYTWAISPASAGSVISGQGTPNATIQWNNTAGTHNVQVTVSLCGNSLTDNLAVMIDEAIAPTITQTGILCPGSSATLDAGGGYSTYNWSTGATTQTISISTGGTYLVTVTDGVCSAVGTFMANEVAGPIASISTGDPRVLCVNPPNNTGSVTINALTGAGYSFAWYCNGALQPLPTTQDFFVHNNTMIVGTFNYYVEVTDANGCTNQSNTITVTQADCSSGPGGCSPQDYSLSFTAVNQSPNCNIVDFAVTSSPNVTLTGWNFNDPTDNTNDGTLANAQHTYGTAGCYLVTLTATVPANTPGQPPCVVEVMETVCIPLAADFMASANCLDVTFCELSTFLPGQGPTSYNWAFGDGATSSAIKPTHPYAAGGNYDVTLTVTNGSGCSATYEETVTVNNLPTPTIGVSSPACVGESIDFTGTAPGIISWLWDFGDGITNGAQNPSHTYAVANTYTVTLTVTDTDGCVNQVTTSVIVHPAPPQDTISWMPSLEICEGETVTLTAPGGAGYTYSWSTGATSQIITTTNAGTYSVTVMDANDCTLVPDPVAVTVFPVPPAEISGPMVICDEGCINLSAPLGFGYTYQWFNNGGDLIPGATLASLQVCDVNLASPYYVEVTDANGCTNTSPPYSVMLEIAPAFTLSVVPDSCEGTVSTLSINPIQPNVIYAWSTGATGNSIDVLQAGVYTAIGTDTLTGCRGTASVTIYPLPDLCLVPVGCYEVCTPDTICGPGGLAAYQWNLDGIPILGATDSCLIVTESGTYSLTGTTEFGCELTSDSLILDVIDCDCEGLDIMATASTEDSCCWTLSYTNNLGTDLIGFNIYTNDASLDFDFSSVASPLLVSSSFDNSVGLAHEDGLPIPSGNLADFIEICFSDVINTPQQLIIDWYDFTFAVVCSDTLIFDCPVEPDCIYQQADSIYCEDGEVVYEMTLCNPTDADYDIGYVDISNLSPAGVILTPASLDLSSNPITPGECRMFSFNLSGSFIPGDEFCYDLIGHEFDPALVDTTLCCSFDTTYCIEIPDCDPCDDIGINYVEPLIDDEGVCCYSVGLFNNYEDNFFDGISLCVLSPATTISINNPFGSGWTTTASSPTAIDLAISPPLGNSIPLGAVVLPDICIETESPPQQLVEIKWLVGDSIVCRDTLILSCEPPCGYILEEEINCEGSAAGSWSYSGVIKNTSDFTMGEAIIVFTQPGGMSAYDITLPLGVLPPGGFFPFTIPLGSPAMAGDTVCFTMALHELDDNNQHLNCCNIYHCIILPECPFSDECICDDDFFNQINQGIDCSPTPEGPGTYTFTPAGNLTECDELNWELSGFFQSQTTTGNDPVTYTITDPGIYEICVKVTRIDVNGEVCEEGSCKEFTISPAAPVIFPNPASDIFTLILPTDEVKDISLLNTSGQKILIPELPAQSNQQVVFQVEGLAAGIYWVRVATEAKTWLLRVVVL